MITYVDFYNNKEKVHITIPMEYEQETEMLNVEQRCMAYEELSHIVSDEFIHDTVIAEYYTNPDDCPETIKFRIMPVSGTLCLIRAKDIRTVYKRIADGGCISSVEILFAEMQRIKTEVEKIGKKAVFIYE